MALVEFLGRRSKIFKPKFQLMVAHVVMKNIPYHSDQDYLQSCAARYDIPFILHETQFDASTDTRKSPCFLCSWTRRKALFEIAKEHQCNKIALGHHQDDILETLLMNMTHQGSFGTMPPKLTMSKFAMEIIRPDFKISQEHGQFFEKDGCLMMALYHPAALLRDPRKKPETFEDLKRLQAKIKEICTRTELDF